MEAGDKHVRSGQIHDLPNTMREERSHRSHRRPQGFLLNKDEDCLKGGQAAGKERKVRRGELLWRELSDAMCQAGRHSHKRLELGEAKI